MNVGGICYRQDVGMGRSSEVKGPWQRRVGGEKKTAVGRWGGVNLSLLTPDL